MTTTYGVFKRKPWKKENGKYIPNPSARKTTVRNGVDIDTARKMCREHMEENPRPERGTRGYYEYVYMEFESE